MTTRVIEKRLYPPLARVLAAGGHDAAAVGLFTVPGGHELRYPDELDAPVAAALADPAFDAAAVDSVRDEGLVAVEAAYQARLGAGYDAALPAGGTANFQIRAEDLPNWLTAKTLYRDQIDAGAGATVDANMRDGDDVIHVMSFDDAHAIVAAMAAHGAALMRHKWALKDSIKAASTITELDAIDIEAGWP